MLGLGIDIGAGSIKSGVFDETGTILEETRENTHAKMKNAEFQKAILSSASPLLKKYEVTGIGVGSPGPIDNEKGIIHSSANLPLLDAFPIKEILERETGIQTKLNNDANCASLGEYFFGPGAGSSNLFVFTLGTGLGGGWIQNGFLYNGFQGNGMEVGHTTIIKDGALCGCGKRGCAESYFSATGLMNRYFDRTNQKANSVAEVFQLANDGDSHALDTIYEGTEVLAETARNIVNLLNVDTIVFVGGLIKSWSLFGEHLETRIRSQVFPILADRLKIFHGENQAILGAGSLVLEGMNPNRSKI
ncbi:MAG: ROK family protein [Leptospira sp.]|nr:ROK family protein [Leptospira sp.]